MRSTTAQLEAYDVIDRFVPLVGGSIRPETRGANVAVEPIPHGYSTVTPYLIVEGADGMLDFVTRAFGAEQRFRIDRDDGTVGHAEVTTGDSVVMLAEAGGD